MLQRLAAFAQRRSVAAANAARAKRAERILAGDEAADQQDRLELAIELRRQGSYVLGRRLLEPLPDDLSARLGGSDLAGKERLALRLRLESVLETLAVCAIHDDTATDVRWLLELARELHESKIQFNNLARRLLIQKIWDRREKGYRTRDRLLEDDRTLFLKVRAQLALCTALASDLPAGYRLDEAMQILNTPRSGAPGAPPGPEGPDADIDTVQRAALIYKRKWLRALKKSDLELARHYYGKASRIAQQSGDLPRRLSSGVEAAFLLDQLAFLDDKDRAESVAKQRRDQADALRIQLLIEAGTPAEDADFRFLVNLAQLHLGLSDRSVAGAEAQSLPEDERERLLETLRQGHLDDAEKLLLRAGRRRDVPGWRKDFVARELVDRVRLRHEVDRQGASRQAEVLQAFLDMNLESTERRTFLESAALGKVGLALSGGGFRAALFHLGVLARLAELDLLRHVEVLSCVSGGSIVGAHYYLKLRQLLENPPARPDDDEPITREDYIRLVEELIDEFLAGVKKNIRTRVVLNPLLNLRMMWPGGYSRTDRAADLFERHLFSRVDDGHDRRPRWLRVVWPKRRLLKDLRIMPWDSRAKDNRRPHFNPTIDNWKCQNKVPALILNATTLNTGHNWQFTVTWMGESPAAIDPTVDANDRLRRMYLEREAPGRHKSTTLGLAVAASACVPGLFDPTTLERLYERRDVRLVDGGVFDNQGVASLMAEDCKVILVSDASGQMDTVDRPGGGLLDVPLRSNTILMERVRQAQYQDLAARRRAQLLRGLLFVHLKKDLRGREIDWLGCDDPKHPAVGAGSWWLSRSRVDAPSEIERGWEPRTDYGIMKRIQASLADIRTDLDSFSDIEAYGLMYSGYRMAHRDTRANLRDLAPLHREAGPEPGADKPGEPWKFFAVERWMTGEESAGRHELGFFERADKVIEVAKNRVFKIWRIWGWKPLVVLAVVAAAAALFYRNVLPRLPGTVSEWASGLLGGDSTAFELSLTGQTLVILLAVAATLVLLLMLFPRFNEKLSSLVQMSVLGTVGMVAAAIHLLFIDKRYLNYGSVAKEDPSRPDSTESRSAS